MESLRSRTAKGMFWSFLDSFGVYLVRFGFSIVIARTLSPDDYGLMGMIVIFISLGQIVMQSGFSMALIQKKESDHRDFSTAFWFNVISAIIIYLVLFFSADAIAIFFAEPILVNITRIAALGIIINSLCSVQASVLMKRMDFKKLTWVNLTGALISGLTGLIMALQGYEVWALVFQTLMANVIYLIGLWTISDWKPQFVFDLKSFKSMFSFGYKILLQGLTDVIIAKSYFPLIGKYFSITQLGYYTNANRFWEIFINQTSRSVTRVLFPAFSTIQNERRKFNINYISSFNLLVLVMFLGSLLLVISSRPFVALALTDKWLPAVPFMQVFFLDGFFFPLMIFNQNILYSLGKGGQSLKIDIARKSVLLITIFVLFRHGIMALIAGQVFSTLIALIWSELVVVRCRSISFREIFPTFYKLSLISVICFLFSHFIIGKIAGSDWAELCLKLIVVPIIFIGLAMLTGVDAVRELKKLLPMLKTRW